MRPSHSKPAQRDSNNLNPTITTTTTTTSISTSVTSSTMTSLSASSNHSCKSLTLEEAIGIEPNAIVTTMRMQRMRGNDDDDDEENRITVHSLSQLLTCDDSAASSEVHVFTNSIPELSEHELPVVETSWHMASSPSSPPLPRTQATDDMEDNEEECKRIDELFDSSCEFYSPSDGRIFFQQPLPLPPPQQLPQQQRSKGEKYQSIMNPGKQHLTASLGHSLSFDRDDCDVGGDAEEENVSEARQRVVRWSSYDSGVRRRGKSQQDRRKNNNRRCRKNVHVSVKDQDDNDKNNRRPETLVTTAITTSPNSAWTTAATNKNVTTHKTVMNKCPKRYFFPLSTVDRVPSIHRVLPKRHRTSSPSSSSSSSSSSYSIQSFAGEDDDDGDDDIDIDSDNDSSDHDSSSDNDSSSSEDDDNDGDDDDDDSSNSDDDERVLSFDMANSNHSNGTITSDDGTYLRESSRTCQHVAVPRHCCKSRPKKYVCPCLDATLLVVGDDNTPPSLALASSTTSLSLSSSSTSSCYTGSTISTSSLPTVGDSSWCDAGDYSTTTTTAMATTTKEASPNTVTFTHDKDIIPKCPMRHRSSSSNMRRIIKP